MALGAREAAVEALIDSVGFAPERGDLLLRLGELYIEDNNQEAAQESLKALLDLGQLNGILIDDLVRVAQKLRRSGMHDLAIGLLERNLDDMDLVAGQDGVPVIVVELNAELSTAYREIGEQQRALDFLDECLKLSPEKKIYYLEKADLLVAMQRYEDAKAPIEEAMLIDSQDAVSHYHMARVEHILGNLPSAYHHAVKSIYHADEINNGNFLHDARLLAAELSRATLRPRQARAYLWDDPPTNKGLDGGWSQYILHSELALDEKDLSTASKMVEQAAALAPENARTMAAQARLMRLRGDVAAGHIQLKAALNGAALVEASSSTVTLGERWERVACYRSSCRAAWEYKDWDNAYRWVCRASSFGEDEPLSMFMKAQLIASRAEALRHAWLLDVQGHVPDSSALSEEAWNEFQTTIQEVERQVKAIGILEGEGDDDLWGDEAYQALNLWRARGTAAFQPTFEHAIIYHAVLKDQQPDPVKLASLMIAFICAGEPSRAIQVMRSDWPSLDENPLVMSCLALALSGVDDAQALEYAQSARDMAADGGCPDCPEGAMLDYLVAQLAHRMGDYSLANEAIQSAIAEWSDEARWHALAAVIYLEEEIDSAINTNERQPSDIESLALEHLERAVSLEPEYAPHHISAGLLYRQRGAMNKAIEAFEYAGSLSPEEYKPWLELAKTQLDSGKYPQAQVSAARALAHSSEEVEVLMLNAQITIKQGDLDTALTHLEAVMEKSKGNPQALKLIAEVLDGLDRSEEALGYMEQALPLFGNPIEMKLQHLNLLYRARGYEAALPRLESLIGRYPDEPELLAMQAEWLFQIGSGKQAVERARIALYEGKGILPEIRRADLHYMIGLHARQEGQLDQAVHSLSEAVSIAPQHMEALLALGRTHQARRELRQAWGVYKRAVDIPSNDYRPYYYAGQVLKDMKDYPEAEMMLRHAANLAPDEVLVHRLLGAVTVLNLVHNRPSKTLDALQ
jgi:tetratricopeptide (TPR) repeat protein